MSGNGDGQAPVWDAERGEWIAGALRWDAAAAQWVPRTTEAAAEAAAVAPAPAVPAAAAPAPAEPTQPAATEPHLAAFTPPQQVGVPAPYGAPTPYGAPAPQLIPGHGQAPVPPRKKLPTGALVGIIAGGLVLLLAIVLGVVFAVRGATTSSAAPETVVSDYLKAVAAGDSEAALAMLDSKPRQGALLSDDALAAASAQGAIENIVVSVPKGSDKGYSIPVRADYTIGGKAVSGQFDVVDYEDDGTWKLARGTVDIYLGSSFRGLDTTVNGVPVDSDSITVFPGTVTVAIDNPNYTMSGTTTLVAADPNDLSLRFDTTVELSDAGTSLFQTAVRSAVDTCIASKNLTAGCGIDIPETLSDGTKIIDGTITRTLRAETQAKLANLKPEAMYGDPGQVRTPFLGGVEVTADCDVNGQRRTGCSFLFLPALGSALVDLTVTPPVVRWD